MSSSRRPLAVIELLLIMRALDLPSLLRFARCSRSCFRAASSPFALQFVTLRLTIPRSTSFRSSRILSHAALSVCVLSHATTSADDLCLQVQDLGSPLHELDASQCKRFSCARWKELLQHPAFQSLRSLRLHAGSTRQDIDGELVEIIFALPHLHTLAVEPMYSDPACWVALPHSTRLTSLTIHDSAKDDRRSLLPIIAQCTQLRQLRVIEPALYGGGAFSACFCSPSMRSLEDLTLEVLHCSGSMLRQAVCVEDYSAGFLNLRSLRRLTLRHICCIDSILPHVQQASALCALTIIPQSYREPEGSSTPTPFTLVKLLQSCPQLHCTLKFELSCMCADKLSLRYVKEQQLRFSSDDLLQQLGARFQLQCPLECFDAPAEQPDTPPPRFGGAFQCVMQ